MNIEKYQLLDDIKVFCVSAETFPQGITKAHQNLHSLIVSPGDRKFFGLSRPENGIITYKAAAEEKITGEAEQLGCESLIIKKGNYISTVIKNYEQDVQSIGQAFQQLLTTHGLAPDGYCVEAYLNDKDVQCMVRLAD